MSSALEVADVGDTMPYRRLSAIYFCYFAVVGSLTPYWGLYLLSLEFNVRDIGFITAAPLFTKLISPNIWGWLADKFEKPIAIMMLGAIGASIFFVALIFFKSYWPVISFVLLYSFFWNAILPQFEVVTLRYLKDNPHFYSRVRVWGSIGFIVLVLSLGVLFDYFDLNLLPIIVSVFMLIMVVSVVSLPKLPKSACRLSSESFLIALKSVSVLIFFGVLFLLQFSHGVYYAFFSIYLDGIGYSKSLIACFWTVGVLAEIVIFFKMPTLLQRFSLYQLLFTTLIFTAFRWLMLSYFAEQAVILFFVQLLHAFSFGVAHAVAIEFVRLKFSKKNQSQGQAFYSAISFGGGAALGVFFSSRMWEHSTHLVFGISICACLFAALLCHLYLHQNLTITNNER